MIALLICAGVVWGINGRSWLTTTSAVARETGPHSDIQNRGPVDISGAQDPVQSLWLRQTASTILDDVAHFAELR